MNIAKKSIHGNDLRRKRVHPHSQTLIDVLTLSPPQLSSPVEDYAEYPDLQMFPTMASAVRGVLGFDGQFSFAHFSN